MRPPLSDIVFFRYTRYLTIFHLMQYYRDIFTIFSKCKLGQNAPKFHSWSAYVEIFLTKWCICWNFRDKMAHMLNFSTTVHSCSLFWSNLTFNLDDRPPVSCWGINNSVLNGRDSSQELRNVNAETSQLKLTCQYTTKLMS